MKNFCFFFLCFFFTLNFYAVDDVMVNPKPLSFKGYSLNKDVISPGDKADLHLMVSLAPSHYIYLETLVLKLISPENIFVDKLRVDSKVKFYDPNSKKTRIGLGSGYHKLRTSIKLPHDINKGKVPLKLGLSYQACTNRYCLFPQTINLEIPLITQKHSKILNQTTFPFEKRKNLFFVILYVFLAGLFTSFTPCVLPLVPITVSAFRNSLKHPFIMSFCYVLGLAVIYSLIGLVSALTGQIFGSFLGTLWFSSILTFVFLFLGLSILGVLPWITPFETFLSKPRSVKSFKGAFILGGLAALIASPCVGPVLFALLAYVAQTQDVSYGFLSLLIFAFGLGFPFLFLGAFSHKLNKISRMGSFSQFFKVILGISMLGLSVFYSQPLYSYLNTYFVNYQKDHIKESLPWQTYSEETLELAFKESRPVVIDFWANWCTACKELDIYTFTHKKVKALKDEFLFLKFDATKNSDDLEILRKKYGIFGLPFVTFYSSQGIWLKNLTLNGFESGDKFSERLKKVLKHHE